MNFLALTEKRKMKCDGYIFPEQYEDIPNVTQFSDVEAVYQYAKEKLSSFKGKEIGIYINGGLTIEAIACVLAASNLKIDLQLFYWDRQSNKYIPQKVMWNEIQAEDKLIIENFVLCAGRHIVPDVNQYFFEQLVENQTFDFTWQENRVKLILEAYAGKKIGVYVTGLTQLIVSTLNAAASCNVEVVFFHFDYDTEEYFAQQMRG